MWKRLIILALAWAALSAGAQAADRKWVKSGTEGYLVICVDQNSIVKRPDGFTQYVIQTFCDGGDETLRVEAVKCNQDMSRSEFEMQDRPFLPSADGSYAFSTSSTKGCSLSGQTAKFVCKKPGPHKSCPS
jgi:hypothetical protein